MLGVLGIWIQAAGLHLPDPVFSNPRPLAALAQVRRGREGGKEGGKEGAAAVAVVCIFSLSPRLYIWM